MSHLLMPIDLFSENQKKMLLGNAVASVKPFPAIKNQANQLCTHTGKLLDHDKCATLMLSAATGYDSQFACASTRNTGKVCNTELEC